MNNRHYAFQFHKRKLFISIIYIFLFVSYSEIESIHYYSPSLWKIFSYVELASFLIIPTLYITTKDRVLKRISSFGLLICVYCSLLIISTIINKQAIVACLFYVLKQICYIMLISIMIEIDSSLYLKSTLLILWIYIVINFITIIKYPFPNGMYFGQMSDGTINKLNWFLGYKNSFIRYYLPAFFISTIFSIKNQTGFHRIVNVLLSVLMIASSFMVNAVTTYIGIILLLLVVVAYYRCSNLIMLVSFRVLFYINIIFSFALIIGNMINSTFFSFVLYLANRNASIAVRQNIWDLSINRILKNPFWGTGYLNGIDMAKIIGMQHSHNMYLWHILRGGFPYLLIFLIILYLTLRNSCSCKEKKIGYLANWFLFILMIMWQFEVFGDSILLFSMVYLVWNIERLISLEKNPLRDSITQLDQTIAK